jgi:hypothetical protein
MWNAKTSFDYLGIVSGKKKKLIHDVCEKFTIPSKGVALLFDRFDYKSYPKKSIWRNLGNQLNIELGDECDHKTPKIVEKVTDSKNYSHLIWLSRRAWRWEWGSDQDNQLISSKILLKYPLDLGLYRPFLG